MRGSGRLRRALAWLSDHQPDAVLVDLSLSGKGGFGLLGELQRRTLPFLVYSMHEDGRCVSRSFAAGALGYVTKREVQGVLAEAIREVAAGRRFVSPRAAIALAEQAACGQADAALE